MKINAEQVFNLQLTRAELTQLHDILGLQEVLFPWAIAEMRSVFDEFYYRIDGLPAEAAADLVKKDREREAAAYRRMSHAWEAWESEDLHAELEHLMESTGNAPTAVWKLYEALGGPERSKSRWAQEKLSADASKAGATK
jgi:hypothetical protein